VKRQAGKSARKLAVLSPVIALAGYGPYWPAFIAAAAVLAVASPIGVMW
jgi:hypothetical protein